MILRVLFALCFLFTTPAMAIDMHSLLAKGGKDGWLNVTRPLTTDDMSGRVMVLDFWTYGCINCMHVVPDLAYLEEKFGDKLLVVGVHSAKFEGESGSERILFAAKRFGLKHPVINDSDFQIWKTFGVRAWPTLIVLDQQGNEVTRVEGEGQRDKLEAAIAKSLPTETKTTAISDILQKDTSTELLSFPARLAYGNTSNGPVLFVADAGHNRILGFDAANKNILTFGDGKAEFDDTSFNQPRGMTLVGDTLFVADTGNHALRKIDLKTKAITTVAGNGKQGNIRNAKNAKALSTPLSSPWDVEPLADGRIAIAMAGLHQLWVYDPKAKTVSVLAGTGGEAIDDGPADGATLAQPSGLSYADGDLFFVDAESSALRQLKDGGVLTRIGTGLFDFGQVDGVYPAARLQHPQGLYVNGKQIIIADTYNNALRIYDRGTEKLSTLKLTGGTLNEPGDVIVVNGKALVADTNHHAVKSVDLVTGAMTTLPLGK